MNRNKHLTWSDNESKRKRPEQQTEVVFIQGCHSVPTRNNYILVVSVNLILPASVLNLNQFLDVDEIDKTIHSPVEIWRFLVKA